MYNNKINIAQRPIMGNKKNTNISSVEIAKLRLSINNGDVSVIGAL